MKDEVDHSERAYYLRQRLNNITAVPRQLTPENLPDPRGSLLSCQILSL